MNFNTTIRSGKEFEESVINYVERDEELFARMTRITRMLVFVMGEADTEFTVGDLYNVIIDADDAREQVEGCVTEFEDERIESMWETFVGYRQEELEPLAGRFDALYLDELRAE